MLVLDLLNSDPRSKAAPRVEAPRHPEKAHRPDQPTLKKPDWIRVKAPGSAGYQATHGIVKEHGLVTVCEEAGCPNIGECWGGSSRAAATATIMLMGDTCTRGCRFCSVKTSRKPPPLDPHEPEHTAEAISRWGLGYVVLTSVDRDGVLPLPSIHCTATQKYLQTSPMAARTTSPRPSAKSSRRHPISSSRP